MKSYIYRKKTTNTLIFLSLYVLIPDKNVPGIWPKVPSPVVLCLFVLDRYFISVMYDKRDICMNQMPLLDHVFFSQTDNPGVLPAFGKKVLRPFW